MSVPPPQAVQLACPNCRTPIRAQIFTVIDVGQQPQLKNYLLSGQLNMVACPSCGYVSMLAAPLIYHDPAKQLFLVHFPQQLNARPDEQEKFIGDATSLLMRSLPPETPRGYLLAPRRFLTLNSLVETVLEADGITKEMIESQRKRVDLISQLAEAFEAGDEQLSAMVAEHRAELDAEFFGTLAAFAEASARSQQGDSAQLLVGLREKLIELTGFSDEEDGLDEDEPAPDELVEQLTAVSDDGLEAAVAEVRPLLDYTFFEALTERIDVAEAAGDSATASQLTNRRSQIVEIIERLDTQARALFEAGTDLLKAVLAASDPAVVLREHAKQIDEAFLLVLDTNRAAAERAGRADAVAQLDQIRQLAVQIVEESLSPEDRFINQLLKAEAQPQATALLRENPDIVSFAFVKRLNELADTFERDGRQPEGERLRQLAREASVMLF